MTGDQARPLVIHFVHAAATPHNNYLLDKVAATPGVELHRHYIFGPQSVPGRPWKEMGAGDVQGGLVRNDIGTMFDGTLFRLALFDRRSVFFVIGWDYPILVWLLALLGIRKRPLIMWDDGPSPDALEKFRKFWLPRQAIKRLLIALINRTPGTYFHTGEQAEADIRQLGVRPAKMESLPFFVEEGGHDPALRKAHGCADETVMIVAGGRLIHEKGYDILIEALGRLRNGGATGWRAVLIGSGGEAQHLHDLAASLGLGDLVDFVPWAEPDRFAAYIHSCDIFVAPARFDHFPTTIIAAMQAGAAVVATSKVGSAVEFIDAGETGLLVPPEDPEALAAALVQLVENPDARKRMALAGEKTIRQWPVSRGAGMIVEAARKAKQTCAE